MCGRKHHDDDDLMSFFLSIPELVLYYRSIDNEVPKRIKAQECLESIEFIINNNNYHTVR